MTDLASALADVTDLGEYQGQDIIRTSIALRKAGDGLSKSLSIAPHVYRIGEEVYVLMKCKVGPHKHEPIPDTDCLELKQDFIAGTATIVDADFAKEKIEAQAERIQRAKDMASGQQSAFTEIERQHNDGEHADGLAEGCPLCDAEAEAEREEQEPE